MAKIVNQAKKILFQLKWAFMSPEKRYVYLWNRTRSRM